MKNTFNSSALLYLILCVPLFARAQSTPVDYRFNFADGSAVERNFIYTVPDANAAGPAIQLMPMAANGYGIWTSSTNPNNPGWFLLANEQPVPSTSGAGQAPGIAANGTFNTSESQSEVKVATNLQGRVRYVMLNSARDGFVIEGFNDDRFSAEPTGSKQININFNDIAYGTSSTNYTNRQVVSLPSYTYTTVPTTFGNVSFPVVGLGTNISTSEQDWKDCFDIAMDAKYLYITWCYRDGTSGIFEIFLKAIDLTDGSEDYEEAIGEGRRPTVACNVRSAPSVPKCELAYIDVLPQNSQIYYVDWTAGSIFTPVALSNTIDIPDYTYTIPAVPHHARILVSSDRNMSSSKRVIYALTPASTSNPIDGHLYITKFTGTTPDIRGKYVDGALWASTKQVVGTGGYDVFNHHIRAIANPYDGEYTAYDEFHCVYQLADPDELKRPSNEHPLMIVRGLNNGGHGTSTDTRTAVNCVTQNNTDGAWAPDPTDEQYYVAVNQMGIHLRWRDEDNFHGRRDIRLLDEPLEENTLLSNLNVVGDGTSHSGTNGAQLQAGRIATLWGDLHWNTATSTGPNNYLKGTYRSAELLIQANRTFTIGGTTTGSHAFFDFLPNAKVTFEGTNYSNQKILVNAGSFFDFYGNAFGDDPQFMGKGTFEFEGTQAMHAFFIIHGGADFRVGHSTLHLDLYRTVLDIRYEQDIRNPFSAANATGSLVVWGKASLSNCLVNTAIPTGVTLNPIIVSQFINLGTTAYGNVPADQFTSVGSSYTNFDAANAGQSVIFIKRPLTGINFPKEVFFDDCVFTGVSILGYDIKEECDVLNSEFNSTVDYAVKLTRDRSGLPVNESLTFDELHIDGNEFGTLRKLVTESITPKHIHLVDYYSDQDLYMEKVRIEGNTFPDINASATIEAAVILERSNAAVMYNTIDGDGYKKGIQCFGTVRGLDLDPSNSLLCANNITNLSSTNAVGIAVSQWKGYAKLDTIFNCSIGLTVGADNSGYLIFSKIHGNTGPGIYVTSNDGFIDLTGVHDVSDQDPHYEAKNSIFDNNENGSSAQIKLTPGGLTSPIFLGQTYSWFTDYSHNNIYVTSAVSDKDLISGSGTTIDIGSIDENYWGGVDPENDDTDFPDIDYIVDNVNGWTNTFSNVICGTGLDYSSPMKPESEHPGEVDSAYKCNDLYGMGRSMIDHGHYKLGYDTLKYMVENCAPNNFWPYSQMAFDIMPGGMQHMSDDPLRRVKHREWVKSVLYLNTINPLYYCEAVESLMGLIATDSTNGRIDYNKSLAVVKYILESGKCDFEREDWIRYYNEGRRIQREAWLFLVQYQGLDSNLHPLDTTLPTIEDLDLEILRGPQHGSVASESYTSPALLEVRAATNPFTSSTEIEYTLSRTSQVELSLFNALGKSVWSQPFGAVKDASTHRVTIGAELQLGTYFLRVATLTGDVQTVKLIKQ